ncbi:VTT domain-containing protein [Ruminococcus sp.]|uniref:TVP38/TMEM64 family protein n=1 Tax=Ruminococcus sp. TaxID=41978 RepID=UPI0025F7C070|nr:VTT domain-containing protein [Ruminococcus sp.]MBQ8967729.1 TVP38/TMEM64 family protein [Ruminococcus sp.]
MKDAEKHLENDIAINEEKSSHHLRDRIRRRNKRTVQIVTFVVILALLIGLTVASIPIIKELRTPEGMDKLKQTLESKYTGVESMLIFTLIQALQVIIAVIPPVQIVGGVLYGWFVGCLLSFAGTVLGTLAIFLMVNRFGRPLVEAVIDEKLLGKYKFLQDEKELIRVLVVLYLIPGIPKDVISYIVPLTKVKRRDFFMYVMPCRLPAILMSTALGSNAMNGNFKIVIALISTAMVLGILGFFFKDIAVEKLNKRREKKRSEK